MFGLPSSQEKHRPNEAMFSRLRILKGNLIGHFPHHFLLSFRSQRIGLLTFNMPSDTTGWNWSFAFHCNHITRSSEYREITGNDWIGVPPFRDIIKVVVLYFRWRLARSIRVHHRKWNVHKRFIIQILISVGKCVWIFFGRERKKRFDLHFTLLLLSGKIGHRF